MGRFRERSSRNHEDSREGSQKPEWGGFHSGFWLPLASGFLPLSEFDKTASQTARDRFGSRRNAQLSENGVDVKLDRVFRDAQLLRNVFIAETVRQQSKDFALARSQLFGKRFIL